MPIKVREVPWQDHVVIKVPLEMKPEHLSVESAQKCVLQSVTRLIAEPVRLEQSLGRVLAEDVRANRDQPPYDVSAMDGYAVRSADLANVPATLEIIEDIKAGDMPTKTVHGRPVRAHHDRRTGAARRGCGDTGRGYARRCRKPECKSMPSGETRQ